MSSLKDILPIFGCGKVVKGFGRGSKELGIPTANIEEEVVECLPESLPTGIYHGFASVDNGIVHKMVMSIGWNPFYQNQKKSMESHLLHKFENDFYNSYLKIVLLGFIRPEQNFTSLDELIKAIQNDIQTADIQLETDKNQQFKKDPFWEKPLAKEVIVATKNTSPESDKL